LGESNIFALVAHLGCTIPIDVILRAPKHHDSLFARTETVSFGAHIEYLSQFSGGFPSPDILRTTSQAGAPVEILDMDEESEAIKLLLCFTHPGIRPPDTHEISGKIMVGLAELAEKFLVFNAMEVCNLRLL
jgi:hypothetical protein